MYILIDADLHRLLNFKLKVNVKKIMNLKSFFSFRLMEGTYHPISLWKQKMKSTRYFQQMLPTNPRATIHSQTHVSRSQRLSSPISQTCGHSKPINNNLTSPNPTPLLPPNLPTMSPSSHFPLTFSLLLLLSLSTVIATVDDVIIRQVISDTTSDIDALLRDADHHFSLFKSKFDKKYDSEAEHEYRLGVFKSNLRRAKRHQAVDPSAVHGVTKFADLTEKEFKEKYLGLKGGKGSKKLKLPNDANDAPTLPTKDLPEDFDWRDKGAVTPVKNQGSCGSCWSFSTTGALEGAHFLTTGELVSLSEQQLVDCDHECDPKEYNSCDAGCNGGLMNNAFEYILKAGGVEREEDYPYTGRDGTCKFDKSKIAARVSNFSVVSTDEDQIAANLVKNGPLAVAINAAFMQTYIGGVSCPYICMRRLDHGVLLVGYGSAGYSIIRFKEKPYWIIKNSWGENWGEKGYYKICRGRNVCGVDSMVSTVASVTTHQV